jgi:hypothetical protein
MAAINKQQQVGVVRQLTQAQLLFSYFATQNACTINVTHNLKRVEIKSGKMLHSVF